MGVMSGDHETGVIAAKFLVNLHMTPYLIRRGKACKYIVKV